MATLTPQFSSERMVRQYVEELYAPAAAAYRTRLADQCRVGSDVQRWREMIANYWSDVSFGALHVEPAGAGHEFRVLVSLGAIGPDAVQVQLYAAAWERRCDRTDTDGTRRRSHSRDVQLPRPRRRAATARGVHPSRRAVSPGRVVSARSRKDLLVRPLATVGDVFTIHAQPYGSPMRHKDEKKRCAIFVRILQNGAGRKDRREHRRGLVHNSSGLVAQRREPSGRARRSSHGGATTQLAESPQEFHEQPIAVNATNALDLHKLTASTTVNVVKRPVTSACPTAATATCSSWPRGPRRTVPRTSVCSSSPGCLAVGQNPGVLAAGAGQRVHDP